MDNAVGKRRLGERRHRAYRPPGILDLIVDTLRITGKTDEALKLVELPLLKHMDESPLRFYYGVRLQTAPAATDSSKAKLDANWNESSCSAARQ